MDGDVVDSDLKKALLLLKERSSTKNIPLMLFMTRQSGEMNKRLLADGCAAILTKPIDLSLVYGVLRKFTEEPRSSPRISTKFLVIIREETPAKELVCINLSEGGMYLRTLNPLDEESLIHIKFTLPHDTTPLDLAAEVVRTAPLADLIEVEPGMGLRFINVTDSVASRLRNFIQWEMIGDLSWEPLVVLASSQHR
jgi:uncharacterized protein (TIGR02266 family)